MTDTHYHLSVSPFTSASPEQVKQELDRLEQWDTNVTDELTVESAGPHWVDYADLAVKAIIAVAAVVIAMRLP